MDCVHWSCIYYCIHLSVCHLSFSSLEWMCTGSTTVGGWGRVQRERESTGSPAQSLFAAAFHEKKGSMCCSCCGTLLSWQAHSSWRQGCGISGWICLIHHQCVSSSWHGVSGNHSYMHLVSHINVWFWSESCWVCKKDTLWFGGCHYNTEVKLTLYCTELLLSWSKCSWLHWDGAWELSAVACNLYTIYMIEIPFDSNNWKAKCWPSYYCCNMQVAAKVGPNFLYSSQITHPPKEIPDQLTTEFFADFTLGEERVLTAGHICEPIQPEDIPEVEFELGLAVGIAGEVLPETVKRMVEVSRYVVVDVQVQGNNLKWCSESIPNNWLV